jgi:hypothetical protein
VEVKENNKILGKREGIKNQLERKEESLKNGSWKSFNEYSISKKEQIHSYKE